MTRPMSVAEYLEAPETTRRMELIYGVVREPPAPAYGHQDLVTHLTVVLHAHVREAGLGRVCVSPVDVVLDAEHDLVVQPDLIFVSTARAGIIRDRVWGPPDLVVEVLSPSTRQYDRVTKIGWYQHYGVGECWLVDPDQRSVEVVGCAPPPLTRRRFRGSEQVESIVLPGWTLTAEQHFAQSRAPRDL